MTSFQLGIKPNRRAAGRFVDRVRSALQEALVTDKERIGITQSKIAAAIGVHRSVISRELNGRQDITLGRVAELAWAMGREIEFDLRVTEVDGGQNAPRPRAGALHLQQRASGGYPEVGGVAASTGRFVQDESGYRKLGEQAHFVRELN
jgi:transcriptional regulator with XRE-family HTH domain